jgi:hypothetical protein
VVTPPLPPGTPLESGAAAAPSFVESPGVAARFPDPPQPIRTPAFAPGHAGFTSNAELQAALRTLAREAADAPGAATVRLLELGSSQSGVPLQAVQITRDATLPGAAAARPAVLLMAQQHGDEPAGAEALLVVAQELARGRLQPLLEQIDVLLLPRVNPDGAAAGRRLSAGGIDVNRDHLLLRTPEAQAVAKLAREYDPAVVVDLHEYDAAAPWLAKFGALPRADALLQYASAAEVHEFVTRAAEEWFRRPLLQALSREGLSVEWYHTTSADPADRQVSMGGAQADTARNVFGLRNAVSLLVETRGAGLGRAHLARRVRSHVAAVESILASAARRSADLLKLRQFVAADVAAQACRGEMTVRAAPTPSEYTLTLLDPATGADRRVVVAWDSSLALTPLTRRPRPCGYLLRADQVDAALRLRALGLQVGRVEEPGELRGESFAETARRPAPRSPDAGIAASAVPLEIEARTAPVLVDVSAGSYYVGLDQPLGRLAAAALEPDAPQSFAAHRVVESLDAEVRVMQRPQMRIAALP